MRAPKSAPTAGWLRLQQIFPSLGKYKFKRIPNGTLIVYAFLGFTSVATFVMFVMPMYYRDYYRQAQTENRSLIRATREEMAQGMRPWSDPFERESKKRPPPS